MGHHDDCNNWDYEKHPDVASVEQYGTSLIVELRTNQNKYDLFLQDTRPAHAAMFKDVAPSACPYVAGNYRGSNFPCLSGYRVGIYNHEGTLPFGVKYAMEFFHADLIRDLKMVDDVRNDPTSTATPEQLDLMLVQFLVNHMVLFLKIHPYANGNGHIGRLLMWVGLGRSNLWPRTWTINQRPGWDELIRRHMNGQSKPLVKFVLKSM